jgi:hypothetical protein
MRGTQPMQPKTLPASQVTRWLGKLTEIAAALKLAEDIPGIGHSQWNQVWSAKAQANGIHRELLALAIADVAVEHTWSETVSELVRL